MINKARCFRSPNGAQTFPVTELWTVEKQFSSKMDLPGITPCMHAPQINACAFFWPLSHGASIFDGNSFSTVQSDVTRKIMPRSSFCNTNPCWPLAGMSGCKRLLNTFRRQAMSYQGSLVQAMSYQIFIGGETALHHTESDFLTATAGWASQNRACSKVRPNFSAKRDNDHSSADSESSYPADDFWYLFRVLTSM